MEKFVHSTAWTVTIGLALAAVFYLAVVVYRWLNEPWEG